jgi:subtilisin family serine protease
MRFARSPLAAAILAGVSMTSAPASATPSSSPSEGLQQRTPAVAAIVLGVDGRPTFVEVSAPTVEQAVQRAARLPGSDGVAIDAPMTALASDDPYRAHQWSLDVLKADSLPAGSPSSLVAVVDSGVRATHEDFAPGQVRCDLGADFTREALGACTDRVGHGTHVAGIVGAIANNAKGIAGLAPGTSILPVRVLDSAGSGGSIAVAKGIVHAADRGARVINLSLGGPGGDSALDAAVQYATGRGSLVVVSAGNNRDKGNEVNYPAASPGALSVASTDPGGTSSSFSYSGPTVDLAAPGRGIASLWASSDRAYEAKSGTSMAAPAVSAIASLVFAARPSATPAEVTTALLSTATDLEAPGRDDNTGAGLVDPSALLSVKPPAVPVESGAPAPPPVVTQPAPVVAPPPAVVTPPAPEPPVAKAPAPRARVVAPKVTRRQTIPLQLADYRPASVVSVLEVFPVSQRVQTTVQGRSVTRMQTTNRTVVLGTFRVAANGSVNAKVLPVQEVRTGTLVVRGFDRGGKVVQSVTAIRVG